MVTIQIKHIKPGETRGFNGLAYDSAIRAEWIRANKDKYEDVAEVQYNYKTRMKAMNQAWDDTQHELMAWDDYMRTQEKAIVVDGEHRSTSVGDIFVVNGVEYFADSNGFSPVSGDSYEEL